VHELKLSQASVGLHIELRIGHADEQILEGLRAFGTDVRAASNVVHLRVASEETLPEIASWLVARGVKLYELKSRRKSLEEWFMEVIGEDERAG
jgi:hypothetical protein